MEPVPDGNYQVTFRFYDSPSGGTLLWTSAPANVTTTAGCFTTVIQSIPSTVFSGSEVWLETVVGTTTMTPRVRFTSVPYALRAAGLDGWSLSGNSGTTAGTNFLGTTDNQPLELKVNNARALRMQYITRADLFPTTAINLTGGHSNNSIADGVIGGTISGGGYSYFHLGSGNHVYRTNMVTDDFGTVSGGAYNIAGDNAGTVSDKGYATVGGGSDNKASGKFSVVGGGSNNTGSGDYSIIPGGLSNKALGEYSFAAGRRAIAAHPGSFVWGDSTDEDLTTTAANEFRVRAKGGFGINTAENLTHTLTVQSDTDKTIRLIGPQSAGHGAKLAFGDYDIVHLHEYKDDHLLIKAYGLVIKGGNVLVGTTETESPTEKFQVNHGDALIKGDNNFAAAGDSAALYLGDNNNYIKAVNNGGLRLGVWNGADSVTLINGKLGVGNNAPEGKLDVVAPMGMYAASFKGNVRILSQISGDTIIEFGEGLDYAEGFDVTEKDEVAPGTVLIIDPENPGKLAVSYKPYDTRVAGIIAGANNLGSGVRLGVGQFDHNVALAGRVYCNVDATECGIEPGDLLTTSATPGYAMKATDRALSHGAILGKAMQRLEKGAKGKILVLVTLQ